MNSFRRNKDFKKNFKEEKKMRNTRYNFAINQKIRHDF